MTDEQDPAEADTDPAIHLVRAAPTPLSHTGHNLIFGEFTFTPDPQPYNPEHVVIAEPWPTQKLVTVQIPQLPGRSIRMHTLVRWQFVALWQAWQDAGLLPLILSFDGMWSPRYVRQTGTIEERTEKCKTLDETHLSRHCFGSAFDVNAAENPLGHDLLPDGVRGTTAPLIPLAHAHGFMNGSQFVHRKDSMHFQVFRVMVAPKLDEFGNVA